MTDQANTEEAAEMTTSTETTEESGTPREGTILVQPEESLEPWTIDDLPEEIREAAIGMGWTKLMPVQASSAPYMAAGRDMIVQSRTGSGKTGGFLIPLLMHLDPKAKYAQAIILCPTRELARQVYGELKLLGANYKIKGALVYGGVGYQEQLDALHGGAQVIVGTPGRVLDHIGRGSMDLDRLSMLVFDEADEMLSMGFYPDMKQLRRFIPQERKTWMFSATMPYKVQRLAEEFMVNPGFLSLSAGKETIDTMEHRWYEAPIMDKDQVLIRLIEMEQPDSAIIFCNMKRDVEYVTDVLKARGYNAEMISGDLKQNQREKVMAGIREGRYRLLVATDVAARGIDISDLSHVFIYDLPKDPEMYVHRAGRTARAGNTGVAISFVGNMSEMTSLKKITRAYKIDFVQMDTPTEEQVVERIGERMTILLEDQLRGLSDQEQADAEALRVVADELLEGENGPKAMAMLLDDLYREEFLKQSAKKEKKGAKSGSGDEEEGSEEERISRFDSPEMTEEVAMKLIERWNNLRPAEKRRTGRLLPIVEELAESAEEHILFGLLMQRAADDLLSGKKRKKPESSSEHKVDHGAGRSGGGKKKGGGRGRSGGSGRRKG